MLTPPPLRPGDLVAVVAPSGPLPQEVWGGLAWVRGRYQVRFTSGVSSRAGYLAGEDARRKNELLSALAWPDVKAIVVGRGGYGAMRLLDGLDFSTLAARPRWLVGFSDATALHVMAARAGVASVHGPNVTGLARGSPSDRAAWMAALERPTEGTRWDGLTTLQPGSGRGVTCGGNLSLVQAMASAGRLVVPDGGVMMLEDIDELPYRLDRMLTALRLGGYFSRLSALVFGDFTRCGPGKDGVTVEEMLAERTSGLGMPVLAGAPFGHGRVNRAFVLGREAVVTGGQVAFV